MDEKELKTRLKNARENIQNKNFNDALKICEVNEFFGFGGNLGRYSIAIYGALPVSF